jgi:hypothetical protein
MIKRITNFILWFWYGLTGFKPPLRLHYGQNKYGLSDSEMKAIEKNKEHIEKVVKEFGITSDKLNKTFNDIKIPYPSDLMYIEPKTKKK